MKHVLLFIIGITLMQINNSAKAQSLQKELANTIWEIPNTILIDDTQKEKAPTINDNDQGGVFDDARNIKSCFLYKIEFVGDSCIKASFNCKSMDSKTYFYKIVPVKKSNLVLFKLLTKSKGKMVCEKLLYVKQYDKNRIKIAFDDYCNRTDIPKLKLSSFLKLSN